jgi:hypothetical protein
LGWAAYWRYLRVIEPILEEWTAEQVERRFGVTLQYRGDYLVAVGEALAEHHGASLAPQRIEAAPSAAQSAAGVASALEHGWFVDRAWLDIAPPPSQAARPVVVFSLRAAPLEGETMTCETVVRRFTYAVAVEGTQDAAATVRNAAARLEDLLHRTPWTATGWHLARAAFVDVVERATVDGDTRLLTVVGTLELVAEVE